MTALRVTATVGNIVWLALVIIGAAMQGTSVAQLGLILYGIIAVFNIQALKSRTTSLDLAATAMDGFLLVYAVVALLALPASAPRFGALMLLPVMLLTLTTFILRNTQWYRRTREIKPTVHRERTVEKVS